MKTITKITVFALILLLTGCMHYAPLTQDYLDVGYPAITYESNPKIIWCSSPARNYSAYPYYPEHYYGLNLHQGI